MTTREYLDEQLVTQETVTNRRRLSSLRAAYAEKGVRLSESAAGQMCVRTALPILEPMGSDLDYLVTKHAVLPGAKRDEPLDNQVIVQETKANRDRLAAVCAKFNAVSYDNDGYILRDEKGVVVPRKGNARLLEASAVRLCFAVALPRLLAAEGVETAAVTSPQG